MQKVVVFDFDGTLTNYDTLARFFSEQIKVQKRKWMYVLLFMLKVSSKLKLTSIAFEKETMLNVLFRGNQTMMQLAFSDFAKHIQTNGLCDLPNTKLAEGYRVIILSASPTEYIKMVYPKCEVIGLEYVVTNNEIKVTRHPYGEEKKKILLNMGIKQIDEFYYDSKSDEAVLPIAVEGYKVNQGIIIR